MIFSQENLEFDFDNTPETGYVTLYDANPNMMEAMWDTLENLGLDPIGTDQEVTVSWGIEFYKDTTSNPDTVEEEIRDYFEESFRMGYEDYNSNFDWES